MRRRLYLALAQGLCACMLSFSLSAQTCTATSPKFGSAASNNTGIGTLAWSIPTKPDSLDGQYSVASQTVSVLGHVTTQYLLIQGFGFNFNSTDSICGIVVKVIRHAGGLGVLSSIKDKSVVLMFGATPSPNDYAATGTAWPITDDTATYGGSGDKWRSSGSWTPAQVNASNFGVAISANLNGGVVALALSANIDAISVTIYGHSATGLAITMERFSAVTQGQGALLNWSAVSTNQLDEFRVQRSADSKSWADIAAVEAVPGQNDYSYFDPSPSAGSNYYRLVLENYGEAPTYSVVTEVGFKGSDRKISVYPNPVTDGINVASLAPIGKVILRDTQGRTLKLLVPAGGSYSVQIPVPGLSRGLYLLQVDQQVFEILKQ